MDDTLHLAIRDLKTGIGSLPICQISLKTRKPAAYGYPTLPQSLGEHLRRRRMDLGLLQREVASRIGVCEASVWNWEREKGKPEPRHLPALLSFIGYDPRPVPDELSQQLVHFREGRGWSQARLAAMLNVNQATLARWEGGEREPARMAAERLDALPDKPVYLEDSIRGIRK